MNEKVKNVVGLIACLAVTFAAALFGGLFTGPAIPGWYAGLAKPWFNPPSWVFGPVWTVLYAMMGAALFLVWRERRPGRTPALALYAIQLVLNGAWTPIFFGWKRPDAAFIVIVALWIAIAATVVAFKRVTRTAALLLVPYLLWVGFAAVLNFTIWRLNP